MVKKKETIGLSREFIIHPGETLQEILEERNMSQRELAIRTGVTEKHVSTIVNGLKGISAAYAKKLEYAFGIEASFWMNLQANYDREIQEFEDLNNISKEEIDVLKNLKEVLQYWHKLGWVNNQTSSVNQVLDIRKIFGISNLLDTTKISYPGAYRAQIKNNTIDPYVLFAWQRMCELLTDTSPVSKEIDIDLLKEKISDIKSTMFLKETQIEDRLKEIFKECGITFMIVPSFRGAPVQGFIKKKSNNSIILCMTIRQKFADIFWFTLFHEIAHLINNDIKNCFIDFESVSNEIENRADKIARECLINQKDYINFISIHTRFSKNDIDKFAESQKVKSYIVQGRLMKDEFIPWSNREKYEWV